MYFLKYFKGKMCENKHTEMYIFKYACAGYLFIFPAPSLSANMMSKLFIWLTIFPLFSNEKEIMNPKTESPNYDSLCVLPSCTCKAPALCFFPYNLLGWQ